MLKYDEYMREDTRRGCFLGHHSAPKQDTALPVVKCTVCGAWLPGDWWRK